MKYAVGQPNTKFISYLPPVPMVLVIPWARFPGGYRRQSHVLASVYLVLFPQINEMLFFRILV